MYIFLLLIFAFLFFVFLICYHFKSKYNESILEINFIEKQNQDILSTISKTLRLRAAVLQERIKKEIRRDVFDKYIINDFNIPEAYPSLAKINPLDEKINVKLEFIDKYIKIISYYEDLMYCFSNLKENDLDEDEQFNIKDIYEDAEAEMAIDILKRQANIENLKGI